MNTLILVIIVIVVIAAILYIFKDKIFKKKEGGPGSPAMPGGPTM